MKLTIYIVDDEQMAIQYLHFMLEKTELEYEVVGESTNSKRALSEILSLKPDLVFADINMPVIDGLELTDRILKKVNTKIFLLTSYRDFDYVKRGLHLGAADYILKNEMTQSSLKELLEKAERDLIQEKKKTHVILEHNIRRFLNSMSGSMEDHIYEDRPLQRYALVGVLRSEKIRLRHPDKEGDIYEADSYEMENLDYPSGLQCTGFVQMAKERWYGIFFIHEAAADSQPLLIEGAHRIISDLQKKGMHCQCLISDTCHRFFELQQVYKEMEKLEEYMYADEKETCFTANELRKEEREEIPTDQWIDHIDDCVERQESLKAWEYLQELFRKGRENLTFREYMDNARRVFKYLSNEVSKRNLRAEILDIPEEYDTIEALEKNLSECLGLLFKEANQNTISEYSVHVQRALIFIRRNYQNDISVPEIAEAAKVSEGHLRRLFKQEMNVRVIDYLVDYRLGCAKLLMEHGEDSLSEIWQKTGFTSSQYFSYVFKRKEGILPKDYIKQYRREHGL